MSGLEYVFSPGTIERLGWMLVHLLWQATVVAVLLAIVLRLLQKTDARVRYASACAALALMVVLPLVTLRFIAVPGPVAEASPPPITVVVPSTDAPASGSEQAGSMEYWNDGIMGNRSADAPPFQYSSIPSFPSAPIPLRERIASALEPALPCVVLAWLVGVFGLSAWHLGGWAQLQRLKRRMVREIGAPLHRKLEELTVRLGVRRAVRLLESALVEVPTVVGWLRPVILLPVSALTGLRPEQLEAILAHELAHIRRYDYLANMLQTVVEILGFYHPAVWWVSHRIRIERENCCDDLAVQVCGSSLQYARALACMEEIRHSAGDLALAATGGSLMARIARLLGRPAVEDRRFAWLPGLIALLLVVGIVIPAAFTLGAGNQPQGETDTAQAVPVTHTERNAATRDTSTDPAVPPALAEIWSRLSALDAERFELARQRWEALSVVEQAQRILRDWNQRGPTEEQRQAMMTEDQARRFLAQAEKQLGAQWRSHLRGHVEALLTREERGRFDSRGQALVREVAALGEPVVKALVHTVCTEGLQPSGVAAKEALRQIDAPAVPALLEAIASRQQQPRRALLGILADLRDSRAEDTFRRLLDDPDAHARLPALQGLEKLHRVSQDMYLRCLEDDYDWLRHQAVSGLAETGDEQAIPALMLITRYDPSADKFGGSWLGQAAFRAIQRISQRTGKPVELPPDETWRQKKELTFEFLSEAARCNNAGIRQQAITALALRFHDKRTLELLLTLLGTDANPKVRAAAAMGISQLFANTGPQAQPLEMSQAEREPVFNTLLDLIGKEPSSSTSSVLYTLVAVGGPYLPGYPRFSELFALSLRCLEGQDRNLQQAGLHVLSRLGHTRPKALPRYVTAEVRQRLLARLVAGMEDLEVSYRIRFIETLGYLRERSVVPRLIQLLEHNDAVIRSFAVQALGSIGDPRALPALEELAQHDAATDSKGDFYLRTAAGKAIEQIRAANPPGALDPTPGRKDAVNAGIQVQTEAQSDNGPADQTAQIYLDFKIVEVRNDLRVDHETAILMANALGPESRLARELLQPGRRLDLPLGEILKRYVVPQSLSETVAEAMSDLLQSRGYLDVSSKPRLLVLDGSQAQVRVAGRHSLPASDSPDKIEKIEYGTIVNATPHVLDGSHVDLKLMAEVSDLVPGSDPNRPAVARTSAETSVLAANDRYLLWAALEPAAATSGPEAKRHSLYVMVKPHINLPPQGTARAAAEQEPGDARRQVLLNVRTVTVERSDLLNLGVEWSWPKIQAGVFSGPAGNPPGSGANSDWPNGVQMGYTPDQTFTDSLLSALDRLQENGQAEISGQQILAQDGRRSEIKALMEKWYTVTAPAAKQPSPSPTKSYKTEAGTVVTITPYVGDNGDITLQTAVEVSTYAPYKGGDLPLVTRRTAKNAVTIRDGGTVALAGLTENRIGSNDKSTREIAIFVTAHLVSDNDEAAPATLSPVEPRTQESRDTTGKGSTEATLTASFANTDLLAVLAEISQRTGVKITPDATVKATSVTAQLAEVSPEIALQQILKGTPYTFRKANGGTYLVFRPLSFTFPQVELVQVIQHLSAATGVPIVAAPNVSGTVTVTCKDSSLDEALEFVLAGKPYVFRKMSRYYLVTDRAAAFPPPRPSPRPAVRAFAPVTAAFAQTDLRDALAEISKCTGASITPDATVKPTPITAKLASASVDMALQQVLKDTRYSFRERDDGTYLVFRPLSNAFPGINLLQALQDLSATTSVPIVAAPNVSGTVSVAFKNWSLEEVLELVLAGKPYVFTKMPRYYVVSDARTAPVPPLPPPQTPIPTYPKVTAAFTNMDLREVLAEIARRTGAPIAPDASVKPTLITAKLAETSVDAALRQVLQGTDYTFKRATEGSFLVFRPLSNRFPGCDLVRVLQDLSTMVSVPIVPAPNVSGTVTVTFKDLSLDEALELVLAGKPYVFKKMPEKNPRYYLVADRSRLSSAASPEQRVVLRQQYVNSDEIVREGAKRIVKIERELIVLQQTLAPDHPSVVQKNKLLKALREALDQKRKVLEQQYDASLAERLKTSGQTPADATAGKITAEQAASLCREYVNSDPMVQELSRNIVETERDLTVLQQTLASSHPTVVQKNEILDAFRRTLDQKRTELEQQFDAGLAERLGTATNRNHSGTAGASAPEDRGSSQAWHILRQWNCPPLLLGLTQQLAKMLEPSRRNDPVWQEVSKGGALRLKLDVEGDLPGEVIVGLFKDAQWSAPPVAVRRLDAGTHVLTGLPVGRYQIGAMLGSAPVPLALGVHRTWPEPVEIKAGQTTIAEVLVAEAFQKWASGWYNREVAKDYLGQWDDLHEDNLLQGQLTGPDGKPIPFGLVEIREHHPGASGIATADQGTNEQGVFKFDGMNWPYRITAVWREGIPSVWGQRRQRMYLNRVLEGAQRESFRFAPFPEGTAKVAGRVIDQNGKPVQGFFLRVSMPPFSDLDLSRLTDGYKTQITYDVPFISEEGRFELGGLPAGRATVDIVPFEVPRYQHERGKDVILEAGQTTQVEVALVGKGVFYGRVLFEDGTPAVIRPRPWRGAATRIMITFGFRAGGVGEVGPDGYFTFPLGDSDKEALTGGSSRLIINVPTDQENRWDRAGEFPHEKLSEDKSQAGVVTVRRPGPTPTLPAKLRRGGPLPSGWRLEYYEETRPDRRRMTQVLLETRLAGSDEEQLELYGPDGKKVRTLGPRSTSIIDKTERYTLIGVLKGEREPNEWPVTHGPFTLDLSRPGRYTLTGDLGIQPTADEDNRKVGAVIPPGGGGALDGRAWHVMRQSNGAPLLLGLTQQLLKALQPARQEDVMWREVAGGGSLKLDVKVEQETGREIVVGLFQDAKWSQEPVAVRLLPKEGTYTLTGLPAGQYQIGAMIGRAPSAAALGVPKTWPEAIEIKPGRMTEAELLVSRDFARNASGWYNREVSRDYTGDWSLLNENRLLQGRLTGPDSTPISFGRVSVREYQGVRTDSIAAPELGTNEAGVYKFDGMKWPYRVSATWSDTLPDRLGCRYQHKTLNRVFEGPQRLDFQFDQFPAGTAQIAGRVVDKQGAAVTMFRLRVRTLESTTPVRTGGVPGSDDRVSTTFEYVVPFRSPDGSFALHGLPAGRVAVNALAFDYRPYRHEKEKEVVLAAGKTTDIHFEMIHNQRFYGRVLFEDGRPAMVSPAPWEGAKTTIRIDETRPFGLTGLGRTMHDVAEVDAEGRFCVYFPDTELEGLRSGTATLRIRLPGKHRDEWPSAGTFPFDKLSEDQTQAGTVTIQRPSP